MSNAPMVPLLQSAARQAPAGDTPLKHSFMGRMIIHGAGPKGNVPAPKSVIPAPGPYDASVLERFESDVRALQDLARSMAGKDLGRVKVTSPLASFVRYSLYDALEIIIQHTERHVGQVERFAAKMSD